MKTVYIGIDVQVSRPCVFAAVDETGTLLETGWFEEAHEAFQALETWAESCRLHLGIDAPRQPLSKPRKWYWNGPEKAWRERKPSEKGVGRHCEVAVKAHNLANPQWTPLRGAAPAWMQLGFELFQTLESLGTLYEAFPSATYTMLHDDPAAKLTIDFSNVRKRGAGDLFDALAAAVTVKEFVEGRGMEMGGGDGLGSIILPRRIDRPIDAVLQWPNY
ncbi:hypothetical protein [Pontiella sp.]|uniref:hypothetical protein n=1 Tax=Pontiella sp. TaxID=2837462 RepID=UPI003562449F